MAEQQKIALVIEDDEVERKALVKRLRRCGYDVHEASDMEQARRLMRRHSVRYDLFVVDVILPRTPADATAIDRLVKKRRELLLGGTRARSDDGRIGPADTDQLRRYRTVHRLDEEIDEHQDDQGGVTLVREYARAGGSDTPNGNLCRVPTLFLTGREFPPLEKEALSLVAEGKGKWLVKPAEGTEIQDSLRKIGAVART